MYLYECIVFVPRCSYVDQSFLFLCFFLFFICLSFAILSLSTNKLTNETKQNDTIIYKRRSTATNNYRKKLQKYSLKKKHTTLQNTIKKKGKQKTNVEKGMICTKQISNNNIINYFCHFVRNYFERCDVLAKREWKKKLCNSIVTLASVHTIPFSHDSF